MHFIILMVKKVTLDDGSDQSDSSEAPMQLSKTVKASAKAKQSKLKVKERKSKISKLNLVIFIQKNVGWL